MSHEHTPTDPCALRVIATPHSGAALACHINDLALDRLIGGPIGGPLDGIEGQGLRAIDPIDYLHREALDTSV